MGGALGHMGYNTSLLVSIVICLGFTGISNSTYSVLQIKQMEMVYFLHIIDLKLVRQNGPRQANLVLIAYASSEGSGEPAHPRSLARTFAARS